MRAPDCLREQVQTLFTGEWLQPLPEEYPMSQRLQVEHVLNHIRAPNEQQMRTLEELLDKAQNPAPLGEADGSIDEKAWYALRDLVEGYRRVTAAAKAFTARLV